MKILHVIGGMDRGGAESYIMNTLRNIDREKFQCDILTFLKPRDGKKYVYEDELKTLGVKIIKIDDNRFRKPWKFTSDIEKVLRDGKYDAIHSHIDFMSFMPLKAAKKAGIQKRFSHSHNTNNTKLEKPIIRLMSKYFRVRLNSQVTTRLACGEDAGRFLYGKNKPFTVIHNGIDLKKFHFNANSRQMMRAKLKIDEDALVMLNVGRFEEQKNQEQAINIFADYYRKHPTARLVIIGEGSLRQQLEDKIASERLEEAVLLLPAQDAMERFYSMADIFVLPSLFECVPTVGIEAQASGMKCLFSTNVPKETKLLKTSEFLSLEDNWRDYIKPVDQKQRSEATKEPAVKEYDVKNTVKKLEGIYEA
ncbi:glycosyltransferase [Candidatus Saccharibacteria bacterium]|nr:glycosyltransferase [Candidatus Saccharibacteria bacterium]